MITFKCKMCGGDLTFEPGASVAECSYCGTTQTLPKLDDDKRANLYDRANHFRRQNEYDKAMSIYEQILAEDRADAEAYWSLVLCRYGVEYVEDPSTRKRVPTVNRAQYASILADEDYRAALTHADAMQRGVYEAEAAAIAEIQKGILDISSKEEPFDVFICYKETDENGRRTPDSVLATDLYHQLTKEGFKVFFSRITLEDKIGSAYEPYIFAALNSAKVMVALGTKPQYFNAVWVKNEWSRYLALIRAGSEKTLVPAYRDMDPYDLPDEFAHLQALDMGKLGFMQDLVRGIKKMLHRDEPKPQPQLQPQPVAPQAAPTASVAPLLKRAFMFLEDGDFDRADDFCEQVLNLDPENGRAYLGKLMAELNVELEDDLKYESQPFDDNSHYQKVMRFGDEALKKQLQADIDFINQRNEHQRQKDIFNAAKQALKIAETVEQVAEARRQFESIPDFEGVSQMLVACDEKTEQINQQNYSAAEALQEQRRWGEAIKAFEMLNGYRDSMDRIAECEDAIRDALYQHAETLRAKKRWNDAIEAFVKLNGYRDSWDKIAECDEGIREEAYHKAETLRDKKLWEDAIKAFEWLNGYRDSAEQAQKCRIAQEEEWAAKKEREEQERRMAEEKARAEAAKKRLLIIVAAAVLIVVVAVYALISNIVIPKNYYAKGETFRSQGECFKALLAYRRSGKNYKDSAEQIALIEKVLNDAAVKIAAGNEHTVGLRADGTVTAVGSNFFEQCDIDGWSDIVAIAAGMMHTVGLKSDGTVVAVGDNYDGQCKVNSWSDIVAVAAGFNHTVGLKSDGTAIVVGDNEYGQCNVNRWSGIIAIDAGTFHTIGLKSDGSVVAVGNYKNGQCDVDNWSDIVAIAAGLNHTVGLKSDGTVVAVGSNSCSQCNVGGWSDIVAIDAGDEHTVGLKSDGTVVAVGYNHNGQCNVNDWSGIVAIAAGSEHTVGLKSDGTVVAVGYNENGRCDVSDWKLWN